MKRICAFLLILIGLTGLCTVAVHPTEAVSRIIVVPDDFPTIAAAVANASEGNSILVKKGTYEESTLETNKTISFMGEGAERTKIILTPPNHNVTFIGTAPFPPYNEEQTVTIWNNSVSISASATEISQLSITSPGDISIEGEHTTMKGVIIASTGVSIRGSYAKITANTLNTSLLINGSYAYVAENSIKGLSIHGSYATASNNTVWGNIGMNGNYCQIYSNSVGGLSDGSYGYISIAGAYCEASRNNAKVLTIEASSCFIHDNNVTEDKNNGRVTISGNGNLVAKNIMDNLAFGIDLRGSNNTVCGNRITRNGIGLLEAGQSNVIYGNYVANNGWGVDTGYNQVTAILYNNNFVNNRFQVSTIYQTYGTDYFDKGSAGNYWSDYSGIDANGDGFGDVAYIVDSNRSDRYPLTAPFNIESLLVEAPDWLSDLPAQTASPTPTPSPSPLPTTFSSSSASPSNQTFTIEPASSPQPEPIPFQTVLVISAAVAVIAASAASLAWTFRKKR